MRAPKSKEGYASIGGGSPLRQITDAQVYCVFCGLSNLKLPIGMTAIHWILALWIFRYLESERTQVVHGKTNFLLINSIANILVTWWINPSISVTWGFHGTSNNRMLLLTWLTNDSPSNWVDIVMTHRLGLGNASRSYTVRWHRIALSVSPMLHCHYGDLILWKTVFVVLVSFWSFIFYIGQR